MVAVEAAGLEASGQLDLVLTAEMEGLQHRPQ
jgi:hypothetical protein